MKAIRRRSNSARASCDEPWENLRVSERDFCEAVAARLVRFPPGAYPSSTRSFDLWGVDQTAELVTEARQINTGLGAVAVLNQADPQAHGKDNETATDDLRQHPRLELAPIVEDMRYINFFCAVN